MTDEENLKRLYEECDKVKEDSSKCKKEWDDIDRWASGVEMSDDTDDYDITGDDNWQPYNSCVEPFLRSKYLKHERK